MTDAEFENEDPQWWVKEPTDTFHGLRVVDHDGTAFLEQVDDEGEEHQSIMVDYEELDSLIQALIEVSNRHAE